MLALIAADVVQRARKTFARGLAWFVTLHEDNRIWRFSTPVSLSVCLSACDIPRLGIRVRFVPEHSSRHKEVQGEWHGRIQKFAKGGGPSRSLFLPFFSPFPCSLSSSLPLRNRAPKPGRGSGGAASSPSWVRGGVPAKNEFGAL